MRGWMMVVVMMNKKIKGNKITRNEDKTTNTCENEFDVNGINCKQKAK